MSKLAAWFPLHKDTKDWSGNGLHLREPYSTNMVRESGVIGLCTAINARGKTDHYLSPPLGITGDHAMFCFLNVIQLGHTSSANGVLGNHDHTKNTGTGITLRAISSTTYAVSVNTGHGFGRTFNTYYGGTTLKLNEWHHVGFTWEQSTQTLKIYVDGQVDFVRAGSIPEMVMLNNDPIAIFAWSLGYLDSSNYRSAQKIQDVRIYNEVPTLKEIKEISKGKFFHLPMNQQSFGSVIDVGSWQAYSSYASVLETRSNYIKAQMVSESYLAIKPNGFDASGERVRISGYAYKNGAPIAVSNASTYANTERMHNNPETGWFCSEMVLRGSWLIHTISGVQNPKVGDIYELKDLRVECISTPTGKNGLIRDYSGYKNNCLATEELPHFNQQQSNLGSGCYYFDNDFIYSAAPVSVGGSNQITMATWVKSSVVGYDNYHTVLNINDREFELDITSAGLLRAGFYVNGIRQVNNFGNGLLDGNWHHIASTFDGNAIKAYIDGEKVGELAVSGNLNVGDKEIRIGQFYNPSGQYGSKQLYQSNVEIYGTALSEEDVNSLFRQRLTVDRKGNFYAHCINELAGATQANKRGELISPLLAENTFKPSIIDYSSWRIGQNSASKFNRNGQTTENLIRVDKNPCGFDDVIWQAQQVTTSPDSDGGFATDHFPVDSTKPYRFTCWFNRKVLGNGSFYFGTYGNSTTGSTALENMSGSLNSNPYFTSGGAPIVDEWFLVVGYVYPAGTSEPYFNDAGLYKANGEKIRHVSSFRWAENAVNGRLRSYLYYSSNLDTIQHFYRPRVDLVDGSEPSLSDLLRCKEHPPLIHSYDKFGAYSGNSHAIGKNVVAKSFNEI